MAITLVSSPDFYKAAYNPIEWKFSSTNVNQCDFQYLCDLYINGSFAVTLVAFADEDNNGVFQIQRSLQDYMSYDLHENLTGFAKNQNSICSYTLEIKEQYNSSTDCTGSSTVSGVLYTSTTHYAWNGALQYKEYLLGPLIHVCTGPTSKFLTHIPRKLKIGFNDSFALSFLQDVGTSPGFDQVDAALIRTYDRNKNLLREEQISNPFYVPSNQYELSLTLGAGPVNINDATLVGSPSPSQPLISTGVKYYSICLLDSSQNVISEVKDFEIDERCTPFRKYRIWFRNRKGMFDAYNFHLKAVRKLNVSRDTYDAPLETNYSEGDRGLSIAKITGEESILFNTNWMSEAEGKWIEELFTSDEVFAIDNTYDDTDYLISGFVYSGGLVEFVLPTGVQLSTGTEFTYEVDDGSPIMNDSGSGIITGYNVITGRHTTTVQGLLPASSVAKGIITAKVKNESKIPLVLLSNLYEEKGTTRRSIQYTIEARPSYKVNAQS